MKIKIKNIQDEYQKRLIRETRYETIFYTLSGVVIYLLLINLIFNILWNF